VRLITEYGTQSSPVVALGGQYLGSATRKYRLSNTGYGMAISTLRALLKHQEGIVTFAQYRHFLGNFSPTT
jgi:hypothetical protein